MFFIFWLFAFNLRQIAKPLASSSVRLISELRDPRYTTHEHLKESAKNAGQIQENLKHRNPTDIELFLVTRTPQNKKIIMIDTYGIGIDDSGFEVFDDVAIGRLFIRGNISPLDEALKAAFFLNYKIKRTDINNNLITEDIFIKQLSKEKIKRILAFEEFAVSYTNKFYRYVIESNFEHFAEMEAKFSQLQSMDLEIFLSLSHAYGDHIMRTLKKYSDESSTC